MAAEIKDQSSKISHERSKIKDQLTDGGGPFMMNLVDVLVDARVVECTIRNRSQCPNYKIKDQLTDESSRILPLQPGQCQGIEWQGR